MAESLVGIIKSNAGKQWNRNTVADGTWLNTNTVNKLNQNDVTLAEAIESVSAAVEHCTPEITASAWSCEANQTVKTIEQNTDGSLNVTYQSIETTTTSNDYLWSWYQQDSYDTVYAEYTKTENDINHISGELSENLTIPAGIYDIKIEVLYEPDMTTVNNKLNIAISSSTSSDDALYETFILFDDTLDEADIQSEWITGIIKLTESTPLYFLIKGETAESRYKLNNIYINSIAGAKGDTGEQGEQGEQGETGASGYTPLMRINSTTNYWEVSYDEGTTYTSLDVSATGPQGEQGETGETGPQGASGYTPLMQINSETNYWEVSYDEGATYTSLDVSATGPQGEQGLQGEQGTSGASGYTPRMQINSDTNYWEVSYDDGSTWESLGVSATGPQGESGVSGASGASGFSPTVSTKSISNDTKTGTEITFTTIDGETSYSAWNGIDGSGTTYSIQGDNGISATLDASTSTYNIGISAHYISAITTDNDTISGDGETDPLGINNTYVTAWNDVSAKQNISDMSAYPTFIGMTDSDYYCWSGTSGEGGQWSPISDKFYSKTEAAATFLQTENIISGDHTGVSGTGSNFTYTYIPMDIVTSTPTVDDGILHIILDS